MKRVLANMSNGYCGCDEQYIMSFSDDASSEEIWDYLLEAYTYNAYNDGIASNEISEEEAEEEGYDSIEEFWEAQIEEYSTYEEISEEEYRSYIEEGIEEI